MLPVKMSLTDAGGQVGHASRLPRRGGGGAGVESDDEGMATGLRSRLRIPVAGLASRP